jgi:predicted DNA-binding transcriptional regulator AlpA
MTKAKPVKPELLDLKNLSPLHIIRQKYGPQVFGYSKTQIEETIRTGEIPEPIPLSASGRARGWTGQQILDHRQRCIALADCRRERAEAVG